MKKIKKYKFLILIVIFISLFIYGVTYAKYVSNSLWNYYLESKGFYFSSNHLDSIKVKNVDNQWNGESVHFVIKNSLNENVITDYDINYNATCTVLGDEASNVECRLNGTESSTISGILSKYESCINRTGNGIDVSAFSKTDCELNGYNWENQIAETDLYFDLIPVDQYVLKDVTVNITVTSTSPYRKVLSGDFILHKKDMLENKLTMNYENYTNYDRLNISNSYSTNKCIKVNWDSSKLVISNDINDFSSYATDENDYINEIKLNINAKSNLSFIFYKKNFSMTYNVNEFSIVESTGC